MTQGSRAGNGRQRDSERNFLFSPGGYCDRLASIPPMDRSFLTKFAWLSIAAAVATITLKTVAYLITGSVGLLSDAVESLVNLMGALMALAMLTVAARPADEKYSALPWP